MTAPELEPAAPADAYAGARDHYTSPTRRDWVKQRWEEPALIDLLDTAVRATGPARPLKVLDVGCGTGVGLDLLRHAPAIAAEDGPAVHYLGVDLDEDLLEVARSRSADRYTRFERADVRDTLPEAPHDLYLSTGVPYSHLTRDELTAVVTRILAAARSHPRPTVLVVDVLGRYSLEWTSRWDRDRWDYRMSFFVTDEEFGSTPMSTYGAGELRALVQAAAEAAGCAIERLELTDRSVVVGRHTATGEYTPGLRPYRRLVNDLADPDTLVALEELRLGDLPLPDAPAEVTRFHADLATDWDRTLERASAAAAGKDPREVASVLQPSLAEELRRLETGAQLGLGCAHSLTATVVTRPGG